MEKPAIEGGKPTREDFLIFGRPDLGEEEVNQVLEVLKSRWLGTGSKTKSFEEMIAKYVGCKFAIALNSCTAALFLSLLCNEIGAGDEVITTPMSFAATANVIEHVGAKPVFVDIEKDSYNINAEKISSVITSKSKVLMPVHFAGLPCDLDEIHKISKENDLILIEDAAHAIGAEFDSKKIGSWGNPTCFSFYATKNLTTGEGGMVCLNDKELADKLRIYSLHGLSKHAWQRFNAHSDKMYDVLYPGYKFNMADINAAIGLAQLNRLDEMNAIRDKFANLYLEELGDCDLIDLPTLKKGRKSSWHLFSLLLKLDKLKISRNQFMIALDKEGIGSGYHYSSITSHKYYKDKYGFKKGDFPRAEDVSVRTVSIPLQSSMTENDLYDVVKAVKKILNYFKK